MDRTSGPHPGHRTYHEALILELIRRRSALSRYDLALASRLSPATVGNIVAQFLSAGLIRESGPLPSRGGSKGGRRRIPLELVAGARYAGGVLFWRRGLIASLTDLTGTEHCQITHVFSGSLAEIPFEELVTQSVQAMRSLLARSRRSLPGSRFLGWGLGVPGWYPPGLSWDRLAAAIQQHLPHHPIYVANNAVVAALGMWFATAVDEPPERFLYGYLGGGLGGSLVIHTRKGAIPEFQPIEIGHIGIDPRGPDCYCGDRGCLEQYLLPYLERTPEDTEQERLGAILGYALRTLTLMVDVNTVIFGGRFSSLLTPKVLRSISAALAMLPRTIAVRLVSPTLEEAQATGAAALVFHRYLATAGQSDFAGPSVPAAF